MILFIYLLSVLKMLHRYYVLFQFESFNSYYKAVVMRKFYIQIILDTFNIKSTQKSVLFIKIPFVAIKKGSIEVNTIMDQYELFLQTHFTLLLL